jgi:hypothetical protein
MIYHRDVEDIENEVFCLSGDTDKQKELGPYRQFLACPANSFDFRSQSIYKAYSEYSGAI